MNRAKARDPMQLRRLIQSDGLPYPMRFDESNPQSYNIATISQNVESNIGDYLTEMDNAVGGLGNFTSIGDFCFEDHDTSWSPRRYVYRGDTRRPTRRPLKNFLRTVLHIKKFRSDQELQEEERAIREILARYPDRVIKIYNMNTLMTYLTASPGVTVGPGEILQYLNVGKVESKYKSYKSSRKYFTKKLTQKGKDLEKALKEWQESNKKMILDMEEMQNRVVPAREQSVWDKTRVKALKLAYRKSRSNLDKFMVAYWDFKLTNDDCFHYLFEYMLAHILDFCKLNPQR